MLAVEEDREKLLSVIAAEKRPFDTTRRRDSPPLVGLPVDASFPQR